MEWHVIVAPYATESQTVYIANRLLKKNVHNRCKFTSQTVLRSTKHSLLFIWVCNSSQMINDALDKGVIFSAIVSDGDNKTHDILAKADIYKDIPGSPSIGRFECIAHVAKRMKSNLFKHQDKVLKLARADKSSKSREMSKEGIYTTQIKKVLDPKFNVPARLVMPGNLDLVRR